MGFNGLSNLPNLLDIFKSTPNTNDKVKYIGQDKDGVKSESIGTVFGISQSKDGIEYFHVLFANNIMLKLTKQEIKKIK